jgi:hypothetical protein
MTRTAANVETNEEEDEDEDKDSDCSNVSTSEIARRNAQAPSALRSSPAF